MDQNVIIDKNNNIKNRLPKKYKDIEVKFAWYHQGKFCYKADGITVYANLYTPERICDIELLAKETVKGIFNQTDWDRFTVLSKD